MRWIALLFALIAVAAATGVAFVDGAGGWGIRIAYTCIFALMALLALTQAPGRR